MKIVVNKRGLVGNPTVFYRGIERCSGGEKI